MKQKLTHILSQRFPELDKKSMHELCIEILEGIRSEFPSTYELLGKRLKNASGWKNRGAPSERRTDIPKGKLVVVKSWRTQA